MAGVITRSLHPDMLWPGILEIFGLTYEEFMEIWPEMFDEIEGELATERLIEATSFGTAQVKPEAAPITYDTDGEGYANLATPVVIALGFQVTRENMEDNLYVEVSGERTSSLAFSMNTTIELIHANLFLNAFSAQFPFGDGQPIISPNHPTKSGLQSNTSTITADFSEASVEDMIQRMFLATNSRGLNIKLIPRKFVVSGADMFNTTRVLNSQLRTNTANNDINAIKNMGLIPEGVIVNPYLGVESTQAWYLLSKLPKGKGLVSIWRRRLEMQRDNEFDTQNQKMSATARFIPTVGDWRALWGNAGF